MQKQFGATPWGIQLGVRLETKGMSTDATVKNYYMEAKEADGGEIKGAFTGHVKTSVNNKYLTFPILGVYKINERWSVSAGPYLSWMFDGSFSGEAYGKEIKNELGESIGVDAYIRDQNPTGEKTEVTSATYDFSKDLRKFHYGVQVGGEFKAYKHLSAFVNLQWGLNGIFPSDFFSPNLATYKLICSSEQEYTLDPMVGYLDIVFSIFSGAYTLKIASNSILPTGWNSSDSM